jgi:hypothetical protein
VIIGFWRPVVLASEGAPPPLIGADTPGRVNPPQLEGDDDMITLVESDNGTIWVLGGGVKRALVPAATWGDTEWGLGQLIEGGLARWATPRKQTQGALDLIPTGA